MVVKIATNYFNIKFRHPPWRNAKPLPQHHQIKMVFLFNCYYFCWLFLCRSVRVAPIPGGLVAQSPLHCSPIHPSSLHFSSLLPSNVQPSTPFQTDPALFVPSSIAETEDSGGDRKPIRVRLFDSSIVLKTFAPSCTVSDLKLWIRNVYL